MSINDIHKSSPSRFRGLLPLWLCLTVLSYLPATTYAAAAKVLAAKGVVHAVRADGSSRTLAAGEPVYDGDTLHTGAGSVAQLRFEDGTLISLQAETIFRVDDYKLNREQQSLVRSFFSLVKGGFRSVTGLLVQNNKKAYRVSNTMATIGIRGTDYEAYICDNNCGGAPSGSLVVNVFDGAVVLSNKAGEFELQRGETGFIPRPNTPLHYMPEHPDTARRMPETELTRILKGDLDRPDALFGGGTYGRPVEFRGGDVVRCIRK